MQDALEVRGTRNAVVGRSLRSASSAVPASNRLRIASEPPASNVVVEKRIDTVWYIGEQTKCRSDESKCQTSASSS